MNKPTDSEVSAYYDAHIQRKVRGFIEGNARVERAWETLVRWAPPAPRRVLEVGCGIGDISFRMTRLWPEAEVLGLDISPRSLEVARRLFSAPRLSFVEGTLRPGVLTGVFDCIVLMDVYEHIAPSERPAFHQALAELLSEEGRIFLSFPTVRFQRWLSQNMPQEIQPVDEEIDLDTLYTLVRESRADLLLYQEVDVWHQGDYAHAVLGRRGESFLASLAPRPWEKLSRGLGRVARPLVLPRVLRRAWVRSKLGGDFFKP